MKKTFLLVYLLLLFAGVKAQQPKIKKPDVIEYREGNSPEHQKLVKNKTQAVPRPVDSLRSSAKILQDRESFYGKTANRKADSVRQYINGKVSTKKPQQATTNKPAVQQPVKRGD